MTVQGEVETSQNLILVQISPHACMLFGGAIGGFATWGGAWFGGDYGNLLVLAAAVAGAAAGRVFFFSILKGKINAASQMEPSRRVAGAVADEIVSAQKSDVSVPLNLPAAKVSDNPEQSHSGLSLQQEWPIETYEVQVKLDLAKSYLEMEAAELAVQFLQEVLEMEIAIGRKLGSEVLRETREHPTEFGELSSE